MRTDSSPSEISSSEIPDSSSSSINFFTLRMSIREPLEVSSILSCGQACAGRFERKFVSDGPKSEYATDREVGQIGVMPELLAREYVAEVNLDERYGCCQKCIAQRDAGVRIRARIDDYECNPVALGAMHLADQFVLRVTLVGYQVMALRAGHAG